MKEIFFFPNGTTTVVDKEKQHTDLQEPWLALFADYLESKGEDPSQFDLHLPNGHKAIFMKIPGGWTWSLIN